MSVAAAPLFIRLPVWRARVVLLTLLAAKLIGLFTPLLGLPVPIEKCACT